MSLLRSSGEHLQVVIAMIEAGEPCEQVLLQLQTVPAGLRAAAYALLERQLGQSMAIILESACPDERQKELEIITTLYQILVKNTSFLKEANR